MTATVPAVSLRVVALSIDCADPAAVADHYDEEIERLAGLGARSLNETKLPAVRWTTFADPEGNEFDLVTWQPE
jgi:Glyoxalase-like domain